MSQELTIIVAATVGALAAIIGQAIPAIIDTVSQSKSSEREIRESRVNELIRIQEEWIQRDVEMVERAADAVMTALRELMHLGETQNALKKLKDQGSISGEEEKVKLANLGEMLDDVTREMRHSLVRGGRRAYSLSDEVRSLFMEFDGLVGRLHGAMLGKNQEDQSELWIDLYSRGGSLQQALRNEILDVRKSRLGIMGESS